MSEAENGVAPAATSKPSGGPSLPRSRQSGAEQRADADLVSTERKIRLGFGVALACLAAIGIASYLSLVRFTDLGMPYVDGRQVAAAVKAASAATPVILLTGWGRGCWRSMRYRRTSIAC
jgi:CheY-like chemotaxis protein